MLVKYVKQIECVTLKWVEDTRKYRRFKQSNKNRQGGKAT